MIYACMYVALRLHPEWFGGPDAVQKHAHRVTMIELQGDILFAGAESLEQHIVAALATSPIALIVGFSRVSSASDIAFRMFVGLLRQDGMRQIHCMVIDPHGVLGDEKRVIPSDVVRVGDVAEAVSHVVETILLFDPMA